MMNSNLHKNSIIKKIKENNFNFLKIIFIDSNIISNNFKFLQIYYLQLFHKFYKYHLILEDTIHNFL